MLWRMYENDISLKFTNYGVQKPHALVYGSMKHYVKLMGITKRKKKLGQN